MDMRKFIRSLLVVAVAVAVFVACKQGDSDGGGNESTPGIQYVSDGGSGSRLTIEVDDEIAVGGTAHFLILATDPNGAPMQNLLITCDTEDGIAILEPVVRATGSTTAAIEHTSARGGMSGVLAGERPGSFMIECRASFGTNLIVRKTLRITGEGVATFAGSAGGGLGGGVVDDGDDDAEQVNFLDISFTDVTGTTSQVAQIDLSQIGNCDGDALTVDPEIFGEDGYNLSIKNNRSAAIQIDSVEFSISGIVTSINQATQIVIPAGSSTAGLSGPFSFVNGTKNYSGTNIPIDIGTENVVFTVTGSALDGSSPFTIRRSAVMTANHYNNCPA